MMIINNYILSSSEVTRPSAARDRAYKQLNIIKLFEINVFGFVLENLKADHEYEYRPAFAGLSTIKFRVSIRVWFH